MKPVERLRLGPCETYPRCDALWALPRDVQRRMDMELPNPAWRGQDDAPSWGLRVGSVLRSLFPGRGTL